MAALVTAGLGAGGFGRSARATGPDWSRLRERLSGSLVLPSDADYAVARQLYWKAFDTVLPAGVAYCATVDDVRSCVLFASYNGIPAVARSGGHSFGGYSTTTGLVIDVSRLNGIQVGGETTVLGPGAQLVDIVNAVSAHGVALAGGTCPTVAMGGYLQGGGIGWQTRALGLGCDSLQSAQLVLADGKVVTCSEHVRPDLFWALRGGGGGNFGIVTRYERRNSLISRVVNFTVAWSWDDVQDVLAGWQRWLPGLPRTLGPRWLVGLLDAAPGTTPFLVTDGTFLGSPEDLGPHLDALVSAVGRQPLARDVQDLGFQDAMMSWFECAEKTVAQCHRVGVNPVADLPRGSYQLERSRMFADNVPDAGLAEIV
ncbi:MAG TPA: FAD-dependent oxidoreductase, partial [Candidatus Dormibacteraeota bacterium]